ncbi:NCS2 family permease [Capilliphycus salinus ALCB114379]|uniref:NCS2 family permease n=1 Tax=Capilliphycus salinus TaxID=2768948 RepID=UPI0039A70065
MSSDDYPPPNRGRENAIARYFHFEKFNTNFRTETLAGVTTFMTMAYILAVNPIILSDAIYINQSGDLFPQLVVATGISAAIGTLIMALLANYPFAQAPGMGLNAFFAYTVVLRLGIDWKLALSSVLIEGLIFIGLTLSNIRRQIITAIPMSLKSATAAGIGLFIAYIGLGSNLDAGGAGIIVANEVTKTAFGSLKEPQTLVAIAGIFITSAFMVRRIKGALLWGILATAILGWILGVTPPPQGLFQIPPFPKELFGEAFLGLVNLNANNFLDFVAVTFVFLFVDLFDTVGTLTGVAMKAGYIDENGELPRANQALMADAIATTSGAILGTSSVTTYIESAAGVSEGGRTGFTSVITAILLGLSILFIPLLQAIPAYATTPTLVIVGVLMLSNIAQINWQDLTEAIPAFLTLFTIPLTFSIAEGLSIGFISYPLLKAFQGKSREVSPATWILAGVFVLRFVFMTVRFG